MSSDPLDPTRAGGPVVIDLFSVAARPITLSEVHGIMVTSGSGRSAAGPA